MKLQERKHGGNLNLAQLKDIQTPYFSHVPGQGHPGSPRSRLVDFQLEMAGGRQAVTQELTCSFPSGEQRATDAMRMPGGKEGQAPRALATPARH